MDPQWQLGKKRNQVPCDEIHFRINSPFLHDATNSLWCLASWVKELGRICQENINSHLWGGNRIEGDNGEKQPLTLCVALGHMVQLLPCCTPWPWPQLVPAPWGRIWASEAGDCRCPCSSDSWSQLPLLYLVVLGSRRGENFIPLVICISLIFQLLLYIRTDWAQVICSQLSWGVQFVLLTSFIFIISLPPHSWALHFQTTQFLIWPFSLFPETQPSSSWLDLLVWFATFHVYFCCNYLSQLCCFHIHYNTGTSQLAKPDPQTVTLVFEFCSFFYSQDYLSAFTYKPLNVKNYSLL